MCARTEDNGRYSGTKPRRPATNLSFNMPNTTACFHMDYFSPQSWLAKEMPEVIHHAGLSCSKQMLNDVIFIW